MTGPDGWAQAAVAFLSAHLPQRSDEPGWDHVFSSAYQMGVMALVALGQAEETDWGAVPVAAPRLPDPLPRWDDVCVAALALARQRNRLAFRRADGTPMPPRADRIVIRRTGAPPPPPPNVVAGPGTGPALVDPPHIKELVALGSPASPKPDAGPTLESLGLTAAAAWTASAEIVLWRERIPEWDRDMTGDPRFHAALDLAMATLPDAIRQEIEDLTSITDDDVAALRASYEENERDMRARFGETVRLSPIPDAAWLRSSLLSMRRNELDWVFYRRWRFPDGWLSPSEQARALEIFHDPLGIAMRCAVLARLGHPQFAQP